MPTIITHTAVALAAGKAFAPNDVHRRFWMLSVACAVLPDADVIGFAFGIPYHHFLGHRGFFHSPFFSLFVSLFIIGAFFRDVKIFSRRWFFYLTYFFLLSASHGLLDAFTNGGLGIALFSPLDNTRYFFPWTPIAVSPIGIRRFLSPWGLEVIKSEILWVWTPLLVMVVLSLLVRTSLPASKQPADTVSSPR